MSASASTRSACPFSACLTWATAASTTSAAATHWRSTRIAAASMRAMSRMSWNRRVSRSSSPMAAPACWRALIGGQIAAQVFDGQPDRRQWRPQVMAQRREQRRRKIRLLSDELRRIALGQELRPFDRDRHDAGDRVERADVERRRRPPRAARPPACRAAAEQSTPRCSRRRECDRHRHADGRRTPACRVPSPGACSASSTSMRDFLAAALDGSASRGRREGRSRPSDSSKRRATCRASTSIALAVSVVSSTSRVRSNRRVTSLRRAIASRARSCAAADRLLAMTATIRNANKRDPVLRIGDGEGANRRQEEEVQREHRRDRRRRSRSAGARWSRCRARPAAAPVPPSSG